jgi:cobalamin biosynthesis Mg chelatase CobN
MKKKTTINWVISTLIILLFLLVPKEIVWGGNNNQTVPTIGPSSTATKANTATQVAPTNTKVASTQPANANPTSTNTSQSVVQPTTMNTVEPTAMQAVATETTQDATGNEQDVSNETSGGDTEATSSVSLPLVSAGEDEKAGDQQAEEASQPEVIATLPSFVLPLLAVLLLVIVYLIIRITTKKTSDKK